MHGKGDCSDHWSAASSFWFVRFISGGIFSSPPLCTVRSTSRWSTESPSRALLHRSGLYFANLLFSLGGCTRWTQCGEAWVERGLTPPLTQTLYTARKAQRTIHGEMYAKGNDAPSDSLTMFSIHRWCTVCTFSQRESAQLFLFLPMPLGSELSPVTVPSVTLDPPADHLCVFSFLPLQKEKRQEKKRASGWLWGCLLAGSDFGNVSCCTHYVWSRVRF